MARLIERLGIAEEMKAKTVLETRSGQSAGPNVVEGKAELAFHADQRDPADGRRRTRRAIPWTQREYVVFAAGIAARHEGDGCRQGLHRISSKSPASPPVLKAKGMEPG